MRVRSAVKYDVKFQFRHGFYYVYALVTAIYIIMLRLIPTAMQHFFATLILFIDPALLGFFFIGGIVLLEKGQRTLESLFVTPFRIHEYLLSKVASLTTLALATSFVIVVVALGLDFNGFYLFIGICLTSLVFTLLGFPLAVKVKTTNAYLVTSPLYIIVFVLPVFEYFKLFSTPLLYLLPSKASLMLIGAAFNGMTLPQFAYAVGALLVWIVIAYRFAYKSFYKHVILSIGGGK